MISIIYNVKEYRNKLVDTINEGDTVIEIGPHTGIAIKKYIKKTKKTIAIDIGKQAEESLKKIQDLNDNLIIYRGDVRKFETMQKVLRETDTCDVLALDIGGGRYPDTVFKVWTVWSGTFKPRHSIIRNRGLAEFIQRAKIEDEKLVRDFPVDGWMSTWGRATPYLLKKQLDELGYWMPKKRSTEESG